MMQGLNFDCHIELDHRCWHFYHQCQQQSQQQDQQQGGDESNPQPVLGIVGDSGSGKTTLLRIIAGLETRIKGRLGFKQELWQEDEKGIFLPAHQRPCVMVFQDVRLLGHISVEKNLTFGANDLPIVERYQQELIEVLGLKNLLNRRPSALSGGEKQRVGLARSLLTDNQLWLFDEPLSAVDNQHKAEILDFLYQHLCERGVQALFVTHQTQELDRLKAPQIDIKEIVSLS